MSGETAEEFNSLNRKFAIGLDALEIFGAGGADPNESAIYDGGTQSADEGDGNHDFFGFFLVVALIF